MLWKSHQQTQFNTTWYTGVAVQAASAVDRTPYLHGSLLPFKTTAPPAYTAPFYNANNGRKVHFNV